MELTIHTQIEEDVFYPACEGAVEEDLLKEAYVEHDGAKVLIAEIEAGGPDDDVLRGQGQGAVRDDRAPCPGGGKAGRGHVRPGAREAGLDMDGLGERRMAAEKQRLTDRLHRPWRHAAAEGRRPCPRRGWRANAGR